MKNTTQNIWNRAKNLPADKTTKDKSASAEKSKLQLIIRQQDCKVRRVRRRKDMSQTGQFKIGFRRLIRLALRLMIEQN